MKKTPESKANRHHTLSRVFEIILFVSLAAASVYSAIRLAGAPESLPAGTEGKTRSDYLLMLSGGFPARQHQDGQGAESFPEPHQDQRRVRTAHVLPQV